MIHIYTCFNGPRRASELCVDLQREISQNVGKSIALQACAVRLERLNGNSGAHQKCFCSVIRICGDVAGREQLVALNNGQRVWLSLITTDGAFQCARELIGVIGGSLGDVPI